MCMIKAIIFDAFGTLFNLDNTLLNNINHPLVKAILDYTREKQLSYTWLHSLMQNYIPFDDITNIALSDALAKYNAPETLMDQLAKLYFKPVIFDDVLPTLQTLQKSSLAVGILSNGTHDMLNAGIVKNNIANYIGHVYSADDVAIFKPSPKVYEMVTRGLSLEQNQILFVSSNQWDVAGAAEFGFEVAWVNRAQGFRETITKSNKVHPILSLNDLPSILDIL